MVPANSGWYGVTAWDDYACPWQSDSLLVCYPLEAPSMEESTAGELSLDGAYSVYQWYNNGVILPGATDSLLILEGPGLYSVLVSDFVACPGVFSNDWTVVGIPGIEGTQSPAWSLFPNPADAVVQIGFPAAADWVLRNWNLDFYDASGKRIHSAPADLSPVDVSSLARGVYTVHLTPLDPMGYGPLFAPKRLIKR